MFSNLNPLKLLFFLLKLFNNIDGWLNRAEYEIGNFFDPPKPFKKGENTDDWCNRITANQAQLAAVIKVADYNEGLYKRMLLRKQLENRSL